MKGKVEILRVTAGPNKGQYKFKLKADNGKNLSPNDTYHNKKDLMDTLDTYFPNFQKVDRTNGDSI